MTTTGSRNVTHRMVRHSRCDITARVLNEGTEPATEVSHEYRVVCSCGDVFVKATDLDASAAYLDHLPSPVSP